MQPDQQLCLEGLLAVAIARIDPLAVGWSHPGSRSSRTGRCRSIWLADVHAPGGGLTELRLFDDRVRKLCKCSTHTTLCRTCKLSRLHAMHHDHCACKPAVAVQVAIAELLRVGEHLAVLRPVLTGAPSGLIVEVHGSTSMPPESAG